MTVCHPVGTNSWKSDHHWITSATRVLQCVVVCCSVLQCVAVCCSVVQCVAVCCSMLQCVAVCCNVLQCVAVCCSVLQCVATCLPLNWLHWITIELTCANTPTHTHTHTHAHTHTHTRPPDRHRAEFAGNPFCFFPQNFLKSQLVAKCNTS